ncbi:MAG: S1C family serine protease [Clostridia bacterium]|nr:S1C family serine protease [Clostridia bacterium]
MEEFENEEVTNTDLPEEQEDETEQSQNEAELPNGDMDKEEQNTLDRVEYTPVSAISDYKPASKGLRVFAGILACVIILTAASVSGYFLGRKRVSSSGIGSSVNVDLASRPKNKDENTAAEVYNKVNKSIVGIRVYNSTGNATEASGVIYSEDGYIITNDHIYSQIGAPEFKIYMYDGKEYDAKYVAGDMISDIAVLKIESKDKFEVPEFGNSNEIVCGQSVVAIGRPGSAIDASAITGGMVSLTKRRVKTTSNYSSSLIETDCAINPGSSGGALVNMYGQVIGITSSKITNTDYDSTFYAIPTVTVKRVAEQLIKNGKVTDRAKIGITYTELDTVTAKLNGYKNIGLYVSSVGEDSDVYGKVKEGDIITHINGIEIIKDDVVLDLLEDSKAGDKITLTVVSSNGKTKDYSLTLKANVGESSYSSTVKNNENNSKDDDSSEGTFDFPFGE